MKTQWHIINLGKLGNIGDVMKFSFIAPSYAERLIGVSVFSPDLMNEKIKSEIVQLSVLINNEASISVCSSFSLVFKNFSDNHIDNQMLPLSVKIAKGERISGYIEKLTISRMETIEIKLYLKFEINDSK